VVFHPQFNKLDKKFPLISLGIGAIWVVTRVIIYYGYLHYGVVFTTLMIMLAPVFIYAFAYFFLKEKLSWKNAANALVISACIAYVYLSGGAGMH